MGPKLFYKLPLFLLFFILFLVGGVTKAQAATLYWVGSSGANTSVASNWSTTNPSSCSTGVTPSASAPTSADTINFDADCDNSATIDSSFTSTVTSVVLSSGYAGTVTLSNPLTVSGAFSVTGGTWDTTNQSLTVSGTFTLNNASAIFKASTATTNISSTMNATAGTFNANNGTINLNGGGAPLTCGATFSNLVLVTINNTGTKTIATSCNFPLGANPTILTSVNIASGGTLSGSGTLSFAAGTLTMDGGAALSGFSGFSAPRLAINGATLDLSSYSTFLATDSLSVTILSGSLTLPSGADLNGTLQMSGGTFSAPSGTMTIGRNFTRTSGTFNHNNGTIEFDGTAIQVVSGSNTFYNLKKTAPTSNALNFTAGTTQTILGTLTLQGASNRPLTVQSTTFGSQWNIDPQGSRSVTYAYVKDSNNTNATAIDAGTGSSDMGNNTNWTFPPTQYVTSTGITYTSTLDDLALKMDVSYDNTITDAPIILVLHGYSGTFSGQDILQRYAKKGMFAIKTYKRSFGGSAGTSDDSAREIYDFYDAVEYVKANYSGYVDPTNIHVVGYSGGGGNVYGLITKFPDYFRTAEVFFGMSDYGYDDTYGWWNNGADSTYETLMTSRIGGTPTDVRNNYYARAHYLGAKNNPYTHIQLFYDTDETVVPVSHGTQYSSAASTAGLSNVVTRTSDSSTTVTELSEDFSSALSGWLFLGSGSTAHTRNSAGYLNWTDTSSTTFDAAYKKLTSLRSYSKVDHFKASFDFKVDAADNTANAFISLRNSGDVSLINSISLQIQQASGVITPFIRIDYNGNNGTPLTSSNRSIQAFTTTLTAGTSYHMDLEVDNSVLTGTLKDSDGNTLETKTLNFDAAKTLDGVDAFGVSNFNNGGTTGLETISGTIDNIVVTAWSRWIHGYP